jgi:hypothetical protein
LEGVRLFTQIYPLHFELGDVFYNFDRVNVIFSIKNKIKNKINAPKSPKQKGLSSIFSLNLNQSYIYDFILENFRAMKN